MAFRLPPVNAVRLFEAAARSLSFKAAAEELHVTPSAISHGVRTLEEWLGVELFIRGQRNLALTDAGAQFLRPIQEAFESLAAATESLPGEKATGTLSVSVPPTFGSRWLIPRLTRFSARYPDIAITLDTEHQQLDLIHAGVDLAIRMAPAHGTGGTWLRLVRESFVPVCAPSLLEKFNGLAVEEILRQAPLIHVTTVAEDWVWWFRQSMPSGDLPNRAFEFDIIRMAIDAALQGLGVVLGRKPLIEDELMAGRLVEIGTAPRQGETCYWLVGEDTTFKRAEARLFRRWLIDELQADSETIPLHSEPTGERKTAQAGTASL